MAVILLALSFVATLLLGHGIMSRLDRFLDSVNTENDDPGDHPGIQ